MVEEGQPRRTLPSVGENIPLFDTGRTDTPLLKGDGEIADQQTNEDEITDKQTNDQQVNSDPCVDMTDSDPRVDLTDIPTGPIQQTEPRRSSRISQPSAT